MFYFCKSQSISYVNDGRRLNGRVLNIHGMHNDQVKGHRREFAIMNEVGSETGYGQRNVLPAALVALSDPVDLEVPSLTAGRKIHLNGECMYRTTSKLQRNIEYIR